MGQVIETPEGRIVVSSEVIATIAGLAATECFGVVGMAARGIQDGIAGILGRDNLTRGVGVQVEQGRVIISLGVIVGYGARISEVAHNIIEQVRYAVEEATGLRVSRVNVDVQGVRLQE